jgi:hypothetical protein
MIPWGVDASKKVWTIQIFGASSLHYRIESAKGPATPPNTDSESPGTLAVRNGLAMPSILVSVNLPVYTTNHWPMAD